jgi:pimeloyl-ACP methyl ester carboxylesterase
VLAFDIPGTGESSVPMTRADGGEIVRGLIAHARTLRNGVVAFVGVSMGGHYAARFGLAGEVDAAVDFGGPVEAFFAKGPSAFGMPGIIGNTLGFDAPPSAEELSARLAEFSLRPLLVVGHSLGGHDHRYRVAASAVVAQLIYCWRGRAWARSEWVNGPKWRRLALY